MCGNGLIWMTRAHLAKGGVTPGQILRGHVGHEISADAEIERPTHSGSEPGEPVACETGAQESPCTRGNEAA